MNRKSVIKSFIFCFFSISAIGCNEIAQVVTPTCSDETTLTLVRQILSENIAETGRELPPEELEKRLTFTLPHATKLEENIRKYSCEATLIAKNKSTEHKMSLEYESQLDDNNNHLVQITNITNGDVDAMKSILTAEKANTAESQSHDTTAAITPSTTDNPKFMDYPAPPIFSGPPAKLLLDSDLAKEYQTRLTEAMSSDPAFAGEYVEALWGCGSSGCIEEFLVNKRTGKVVETTFRSYSVTIGYEDSGELIEERVGEATEASKIDSRLLVTKEVTVDSNGKPHEYFAKFYEIDNGQLKLIKKVAIPKPAPATN